MSETDTKLVKDDSPQGIVAYLESIAPKLEQAATKHLHPDRLIRVFLGLAARNTRFYECTRESIVNALSLCNQTGLEPGGVLGLAYLIPRRNKHNRNRWELNFQPGYKGLAQLARRSEQVERINASPVYQWELNRDLFEYTHEPPGVRHEWVPDPDKCLDKDIVGAYAVVILKDGMRVQCWLSREQIEKRRAKGTSKGGIWNEWYPEMCRKTALRALLNGGMVPITTELATAMEHDPDSWTREDPNVTVTRTTRRTAAFLKAAPHELENGAIDTTAEPVEDPPPPDPDVPPPHPAPPPDGAPSWYDQALAVVTQIGDNEKSMLEAAASLGIHRPPEEWSEQDMNDVINEIEK